MWEGRLVIGWIWEPSIGSQMFRCVRCGNLCQFLCGRNTPLCPCTKTLDNPTTPVKAPSCHVSALQETDDP